MKNVGSAQHLFLWPGAPNDSVMVDFGISSDCLPAPALCSPCGYYIPKTIILSHFHSDHYNGLFALNNSCCIPSGGVENFYYPKMPQILGTNAVSPLLIELLKAVVTLNIALSFTVSKQLQELYTLLEVLIKRSPNSRISFIPVNTSSPDICVNSHKIEILWPEATIDQSLNTQTISDFLSDFYRLLEQSEAIRVINIFVQNLSEQTRNFQNEFSLTNDLLEAWRRNIIEISVIDGVSLNTALLLHNKAKDILNQWSIAFRTDDDILFLGDLNASQINSVCENINPPYKLDIIVAAHHGTHKGQRLFGLHTNVTLASIGRRLRKTLTYQEANPVYIKISNNYRETYTEGDIMV